MPVTTRSKRKRQQGQLELELLSAVVMRRDMARARELVELERVNVNCVALGGRTPLFCLYGMLPREDLEMARFLLEKGANPDARDAGGHTILVSSILRASTRSIELLLEYGADLEAKVDGTTTLGFAIVGNRSEAVSTLLRHGASTEEVSVLDDRGGTTRSSIGALQLACRSQKIEIVKLLLDHGVEVNELAQVGGEPFDPLCEACLKGNVEIVKLLLERGANPMLCGDARNLCPPLTYAIEKGPLPLIRLLLEKITQDRNNSSADVESMSEIADYLGGIALSVALNEQKVEAAQLLVNFGANVNSELPLLLFASCGQVENVRFLLRAGANVNQSNAHASATPLFAAALEGHAEVVKELLRAKADVTIRSDGGETALGAAYRMGHTDVVYLLLRTTPHVWPRLKKFLVG